MGAMDSGVGARLARAGERIMELFGHDDNVTGVAVGHRRRGGKVTDEPVVTVMVRKKRRPGLVSRRRMIPASIDVDGTLCPTDVVQAQAVLMNADGWPGWYTEKVRGLKWGCGVSNFSDAEPDAGTLGAIVRDNTDETIGILSANHVIADNNSAPIEDPIYQPGALDRREEQTPEETQIGRLKRWVRIAGGATAVDAAIAEVEAGVRVNGSYNGVERRAAGVREEEYEEIRPAIGMVVAGDGFGNVWLTSMATTLRELDVTLLPEGSNVEASAPAAGSAIEKVGRTTGFSASRVHATGQSVTVNVPGVGNILYTGLIKTQWFAWQGDSGAMALRLGGSEIAEEPMVAESQARIERLIREVFDTCEILPAIQFAFNVPITEDEALSDEVRDEFMSQSETGRFLITLCYLNTALVNSRLERRQSPEMQAYYQGLYEHYQPLIAEIMANPASTRTITRFDGENYFDLLEALWSGGILTAEERNAATNLGRTWEETVLGMGRDELQEFMDTYACLQSVRNTSISMTALRQQGTAIALGGH
jgi:hypothetical protein